MINWKVRVKNKVFWIQIILAIFTPVFAYTGLSAEDIVTWSKLLEVIVSAISNPYILLLIVISVGNAINDPTTKGVGDSNRALFYKEPN